jgi:WD40 repeat protein
MLRLVGPGDVDGAVRRRAPLAELEPHRREVAGVLSTLVDGRLVTVSQDSVELAHEALLREWPRLRGWIEQDAQGRRLRGQITDAAAEWDTAGRDPSVLYRGARLAAALDWYSNHPTELNTIERAFMTTSRDAAQQEDRRVRRTNRRLRGLLTAVAVLLVAALVGGTLAVIQRGNAQEAETAQFAQRLAAQAPVEEDLDLALLLARQAVAIRDTPQTRGSLLAVLSRAPAAVGIMNGDDDAYLQSVALSPDGSTLAVLDFYDKILFFDTRTYQPIGEPLTENTWLDSLAYSPDGRVLAYGGAGDGREGYLRLIDAHTREPLANGRVLGRPTNMAFTPDGTRLVVVDASTLAPVISVRDAVTLERVGPPIELVGFRTCDITTSCWATHFALTADGRSLLTASDAGELVWWDLDSGRRTRTLPIEAGQGPLDLSPDGRLAAVGTDEGIQFIELGTGAVRTGAGGFTRTPYWVRFSPDGSTVMSANADGTVTLWDTATVSVRDTLHGHSGLTLQSAFSPDGSTLYTVSGDGTAIAWDLAGTRSIGRGFALADGDGSGPFTPTYAPVHPGRFSADGSLIAVGLSGHGVGLWNAADLRAVGGAPLETRGEVKALAFSPDGRTLTIMSESGEVTIWDLSSRSLRTGPIHTWPSLFLPALAVAPDGSMLLTTGSAGGLQLWDANTGADRGDFAAGSNVSDLALSADGTRAAFAQFNGAEVWDLARREPMAAVPGDAQADEFSVALSPDGQTLAVGGYGRFVRVWDVESRQLLHELDQGGARPLSLEFSPDGRSLATAGTLWDVATGTRIGPDLAAGYQTSMMDLSPDGHRLLLTTPDGKVAIWDVDPDSWALRACALANRTLTEEEWDRFLPGRPYDPACAR